MKLCAITSIPVEHLRYYVMNRPNLQCDEDVDAEKKPLNAVKDRPQYMKFLLHFLSQLGGE